MWSILKEIEMNMDDTTHSFVKWVQDNPCEQNDEEIRRIINEWPSKLCFSVETFKKYRRHIEKLYNARTGLEKETVIL